MDISVYQLLQLLTSKYRNCGHSILLIVPGRWKLGQLRPGDTLQFVRASHMDTVQLHEYYDNWLDTVLALSSGFDASPLDLLAFEPEGGFTIDPKLCIIPATATRTKVVFRQVRCDA